jgi:hypothetical protein
MATRKQLACLAFVVSGFSSSGHAAVSEDNFLVKTTSDLVALCSVDPSDSMGTAAINFCHGYAVGVYRVLAEQQAAMKTDKMFCPPATPPSRNEAIASFVTWAKASPNAASLPAMDGVVTFLVQKFPCAAK